MTDRDDDWLDGEFALLREDTAHPDAALTGRIMADAVDVAEDRETLWAQIWRMIGGWSAATGLAACLGFGVMIGAGGALDTRLFGAAMTVDLTESTVFLDGEG